MKRFNTFTVAVASMVFAFTVMSGGVASAVPVITNGLVAAYEFSGNANDVSGNGNNGVVNGATLTEDRFGNLDSAYSFDGLDDRISLTNSIVGDPEYSQSVWFRYQPRPGDPPDILTTGVGRIVLFDDSGDLRLDVHADRVGGATGNPSTSYKYKANVSIPQNQWTHLVFTAQSDNSVTAYLNGIELVLSPVVVDGGQTGDTLGSEIGAAWASPDHHLLGAVDDIYLYNRALSAAEVQTLYSVIPEPNTALLLGIGLTALAVRREKR